MCRVFTALEPANQWSWQEVLANKANYLLEILAWQNANEGVKQSKQTAKPEPFTPDFMKPNTAAADAEQHTVDDIKAILAAPRA
jgi:hypothetical protein